MNIFVSQFGDKTQPIKGIFNFLLASLLMIGSFWFALSAVGIAFDFSFVSQLHVRIWDGFLMTVYISIASLLGSLFIGILSAILQGSKILVLRYLSVIYVGFIRGTPLIMQIYLFFYIVGTAFGIENRFIAGVIILSVFEGAYIAEIIRGSFISIDRGQIEAGKAVGFTKRQTLSVVIIPQLVARTLPALTGQFASIIKDSSLLSMIAVIELTQTIREISASNFRLFECYLLLGGLYLILTLPISLMSKGFERRFNYEN
ncbi:MAG: amino acid ABC transporter permease [Eubacteriaceae bacterium]